jgi:hypothetical protein
MTVKQRRCHFPPSAPPPVHLPVAGVTTSSPEAAFPELCMTAGCSWPGLAGQRILPVNAVPTKERSFAMKRQTIRIAVLCVLLATSARAADLHVVSSGGFAAAYKTLAPVFEQKTGDRLVTE